MQRLMIAMAFSEGHSALAPRCWERVSGGGHCGSALVQIPDHEDGEHGRGGSSLICRGKECNNLPSYICKQSHHNRGLCNSCAVRERSQLLGPTGSTHVYNGHVSRVDANGKIYIQGFASRKPPLDETGMFFSSFFTRYYIVFFSLINSLQALNNGKFIGEALNDWLFPISWESFDLEILLVSLLMPSET